MSTPTPAYVEDGRACQIVTVADLLPGDEILGWQGEPWTFGTVESVERVPRPTLRGDVTYSYLIHMTDRRGYAYVKGDDFRRIAARKPTRCAAHTQPADWTARCTCPAHMCPPEEAGL